MLSGYGNTAVEFLKRLLVTLYIEKSSFRGFVNESDHVLLKMLPQSTK